MSSTTQFLEFLQLRSLLVLRVYIPLVAQLYFRITCAALGTCCLGDVRTKLGLTLARERSLPQG